MCRALAQKLSIRLGDALPRATLIEINTNAMLSKYFGESGKLIGATFERVYAAAQDPATLICVVMDEVETIAGSRERSTTGGECNDGMRATNQLLTALDRLRVSPLMGLSNDACLRQSLTLSSSALSICPMSSYYAPRTSMAQSIRPSLTGPISSS